MKVRLLIDNQLVCKRLLTCLAKENPRLQLGDSIKCLTLKMSRMRVAKDKKRKTEKFRRKLLLLSLKKLPEIVFLIWFFIN